MQAANNARQNKSHLLGIFHGSTQHLALFCIFSEGLL